MNFGRMNYLAKTVLYLLTVSWRLNIKFNWYLMMGWRNLTMLSSMGIHWLSVTVMWLNIVIPSSISRYLIIIITWITIGFVIRSSLIVVSSIVIGMTCLMVLAPMFL